MKKVLTLLIVFSSLIIINDIMAKGGSSSPSSSSGYSSPSRGYSAPSVAPRSPTPSVAPKTYTPPTTYTAPKTYMAPPSPSRSPSDAVRSSPSAQSPQYLPPLSSAPRPIYTPYYAPSFYGGGYHSGGMTMWDYFLISSLFNRNNQPQTVVVQPSIPNSVGGMPSQVPYQGQYPTQTPMEVASSSSPGLFAIIFSIFIILLLIVATYWAVYRFVHHTTPHVKPIKDALGYTKEYVKTDDGRKIWRWTKIIGLSILLVFLAFNIGSFILKLMFAASAIAAGFGILLFIIVSVTIFVAFSKAKAAIQNLTLFK